MAVALRIADLEATAQQAPVGPVTRREPALTVLTTPAAKPEPNLLADTSIHPVAVAIPVAAAGWFLVVAWAAFGGGETSLVLAVITVLALMFFGLFVGGGAMARNVTPERAHGRSFQAFLDGDVDIGTGRITGREALYQIAAMPVALAVGFTVIALIAVIV
jgi:hypothetical protein